MALHSRVTYVGDGVTDIFAVPFPFISRTHVVIKTNGLPVAPHRIEWLSNSSIRLRTMPGSGDHIKIIRETPLDARLVDFQNGAVLTEAELDLAHTQNFYLAQEAKDIYTEVLETAMVSIGTASGVVTTDPNEIISLVVNELLLSDATAEIQQRISDIDALSQITLDQLAQMESLAASAILGQMDLLTAPLGHLTEWIEGYLGDQGGLLGATVSAMIAEQIEAGGGIAALFASEREASVDGDVVLQQQLDLMGAINGDGSAWILNLDTVFVAEGESFAGRLSTITANITDGDTTVLAAVLDEQIARTNADGALASSIATVAAAVDLNGDDIADVAAMITVEQTARADADSALASSITAVQALVDTNADGITDVQASVTAEATARADADAALASDITTVQAAVDTNADGIANVQASVTAEATARADADAALATSLTTVQAIATRVTVFRQAAAPTATTTGDLWFDTDDGDKLYRWSGTAWVETTDQRIIANSAQIISEQTARADADAALASDITTVVARVDNADSDIAANLAAVQNEATARADADSAIASNVTILFGRVDTTDAAILTEATTRASQDTALASLITTAQADITSINGDVNIVQAQQALTATAVNDLETGLTALEARYGVQLNVNGYITGFAQNNDGTTGTFAVMADEFYIVDPADEAAGPKTVFQIVDGVVTIPDLIVGNAQIENLNVGRLVDGTLVADVTVNGDLQMGTGRVIFDNGTYMKVEGVAFGASSNLIEWFGPKMAISAMTKANAISYLGTDGSAYFGGSLSAGVITNSGQTTNTAVPAEITAGPSGTNGNPINVVYSYTYSRTGSRTGNQTGGVSGTTSATILFYRKIGAASEVLIATQPVSGFTEIEYDAEGGETTFTTAMAASWTYTDTVGGTDDRTFRAEVSARSNQTVAGSGPDDDVNQNISIIATEE